MPVLVGYANGNKYYYNSERSGGVTISVPEDGDGDGVSSNLVINSLEDEMAYYGFTSEEILKVMNKINAVGDLESNPKPVTIRDPITGDTTTNLKGSLVSNSAQSLKNTTEFQKATIEIEKQKLQAMNTQNEIQKKQLDMMDYNLIMQGQIYSQLADFNANLNKQTTAISNQTLKTTVNVDTTKLSEANVKIAESLEVQKEHYDFLKNGDTSLKDSSGAVIKPREVEAKNNAEQHIDKKAFNTFDNQHLIDALQASETNEDEETKDLLGLLSNLLKGLDNNKFNTDQNQNLFKKVV